MLSKQEFLEVLDTIAEYHKKEEKLTKDLHEFFMDGHSVVSFTGKLEELLLKHLCLNISEDNYYDIYDSLSLFVYQNEFGKVPYELIWHKKDGTTKDYSIKSSSEMYDWIIEFFEITD